MAGRSLTKLRRRIAIAFVPILSAVLGILLLPLGASRMLDSEVHDIHRSGVATTYSELDKLLPTVGENAAPIYLEAVQRLHAKSEDKAYRELAFIEIGRIPSSSTQAQDDLRALQTTLSLCRKGSAMPRCVFAPGTIRNGWRDEYKAYIEAERVPILLYGCSLIESASGDTNSALKDIGAILDVDRQLVRDPGFMVFLNSSWFYGTAIRSWATCLNAHSSDRGSVLAAMNLVENDQPVPSARSLLAGTFANALVEFRRAISNPETFEQSRQREEGMLGRSVQRDPFLEDNFWTTYGAAQVVHQWRQTYLAIPNDPNDWEGAKAALQSADASQSKLWPAKYLFGSPFRIYVSLCDDVGRAVAIQRLARISAKLLLYRLDHGDLPAALSEPGLAGIDPFSGKPFKYRRLAKGFAIYSIGVDRKDQGGHSLKPGLEESPDIVMAFE